MTQHRMASVSTSVILGLFLAHAAVAAPPDTKTAIDDAKARLVTAGGPEKYDAEALVVLEETSVLVRPSGIGETTTRKLIKVLRESAIRGQSVQRFDFDPTTNRLTIQAVRVYRADGRVDEIDPATAAEQPAPQWGIYWGSRQRCISVPNLAVGDAVETIETKIGFNVAYLGEGSGPTGPGAPGFGVQGSGPAQDASSHEQSKIQNPKSPRRVMPPISSPPCPATGTTKSHSGPVCRSSRRNTPCESRATSRSNTASTTAS